MTSTMHNLDADRARIEEIEAQIPKSRLPSAEKDDLQPRLDSYHYPILTLPNEITGTIFQKYLPEYPNAPPPAGSGSPTLLSHVCRHWRAVALSMSILWSAIPIVEYVDSKWVPCWLERSRQSPLSIQTSHIADAFHPLVLERILQHRARWENTHLCIYGSQVLDDWGLLPLLRHIELQVQYGPLRRDLCLAEAPLLRSAILWDFEYQQSLLPWHQLTALALVCREPQECTPILQQAVNLVYCELALTELAGAEILQPEITLPLLKYFVLTDFGDVDEEPMPKYYLASFVTPALRRLQVLDRLIRPDPIGMIQSFMDKSGCKLEEICIVGQCSLPTDKYSWPGSNLRISFKDTHDWLYQDAADEAREIITRFAQIQ
ncbi:hypothetical protein C8F01DRAFT_1101700 [Mycena amicta]|nr:hypothetical protein C8F01DRAFT_1101700 [Mycena amicta]